MATVDERAPVVFLLGSSCGDREANLGKAASMLEEQVYYSARLEQEMARQTVPFDLGILVDRPPVVRSGIYETPAWPQGCGLGNFLNMALVLLSDMDPHDLLAVAKEVEAALGRDNSLPLYDAQGTRIYRDRPIDVDIIFYGDLVLDTPDLVIPHPLMDRRLFVLEPLCEILPDYVHPVSGKTVREMLNDLKKTSI